jgi:hypothetical protein
LRWIDALQFNVSSEGEKHPEYRGKPKADFEGDINPKTGEVGGPKKEPLSWQGEVSLTSDGETSAAVIDTHSLLLSGHTADVPPTSDALPKSRR